MGDNPRPAEPPQSPESRSSPAFGPPTVTPGGHVPLRENVRSTSQLPVRDNIGYSAQVPDSPIDRQQIQAVLDSQAAMIKQQHMANDCLHRQLENQWKLFQDEKALWRTTQAQLKNRIHQVETLLRRSSGTSSGAGASPAKVASPVDPALKDAGHTPMARRSLNMSTGVDVAGTGGDGSSTPTTSEVHVPAEVQEMGQQPLRQPREHQDSYFDSVVALAETGAHKTPQNAKIESPDDPRLDGPLGLTNSPHDERNLYFLGELDKKLSNVNLREAAGNSQHSCAPPPPDFPSSRAKQMQNADGTTFDVPESEPLLRIKKGDGSTPEAGEPEPPLRIKKSKNFGSAFGHGVEVDYGKGFPGRGRRDNPDTS